MSQEVEGLAHRAGTVAIIGRPNVGKSTLLNALVGAHVSITSDKPQTTRQRVIGVLTREDCQYVFCDTPGVQTRHRNLLTKRMNAGAGATARDVDAIVLVVDAQGWTEQDDALLRLLPKPAQEARDAARTSGAPSRVVLALSRTDRLREKDSLLALIARASAHYPFAAIVPISAARGWQLDDLLAAVKPLLPAGPALYGPEDLTDRSVRFMAAELLREQAFRLLGDELPYGLAVAIDSWEESPGRASITAQILVERGSQRGIVIGAGGAKLREIGRKAREGIERLLGKPVYLKTHVRVASGWNDDARTLDRLGVEHTEKQ